ncbi:MAG: hypothetical protein HY876_07550 [Coriobacteriales bacterium]|nr:hypothetical protein [Coriobacteriales bacterium]
MSRSAARIVNNFVHDMSTGTWAACVLVIWVLSRQALGVPAEAAAAIQSAAQVVFWLLVASLVGLAVTGGIRLLYWRREATHEELATKRRLLVGKHVAFLAIYGVGSVWAWSLL